MLISLRGFRLSAAVSEKGGGGGETAQSKLEKVLGKNFLKCYQVFQQVLGITQSKFLYCYLKENGTYLSKAKEPFERKKGACLFFASFIRGKNPLC